MSILSKKDILKRIIEGEKELFRGNGEAEKTIKQIEDVIEKDTENIKDLFDKLYEKLRKDEDAYNKRIEKIENIAKTAQKDKNVETSYILFDDFDFEKLQASNYDLRLGREVYTTSEDQPKKLGHGNEETVKIEPGEFGVFLTHEYIYVPKDLLGLISLKSQYKLKGLVNVSGFHVDPGYYGKILFSVYNAGPSTIYLRYKEDVFMIMFDNLKNGSIGYQKDGYKNIPVDIISSLQGTPVSLRDLHERTSTLEQHEAIAKWVLGILIAGYIGARIAGRI